MTSEEAFNFYWVIPGCSWNIFSAKHADDSIKDSEVENRLEKKKKRFCRPCEGCEVGSYSFRFFSLPEISRRTEWRHINMVWLRPRQFQNVDLSRRISWKFGERKEWMFTCYRRRQKNSKLSGVTSLEIYFTVTGNVQVLNLICKSIFLIYIIPSWKHWNEQTFDIACSCTQLFIANKLRATNSNISPDE